MSSEQDTDELEYIDLNQPIDSKNRSGKNQPYNKIALIICVCFCFGAMIAGSIWLKQIVSQKNAEAQLEQLAQDTMTETSDAETQVAMTQESEAAVESEQVTEPEMNAIEKLKEMGVPIPEKEVDFVDLQENTNADIYAWIYIPDSKIDYPIVQHPTDNYYYLNYNLDGSKGYPGCIYTEDYNAKDFSDPNTVIYGHNMKNGTMFAGLHHFEDADFFDVNPYIYIYTPEELLVYEIFAAYEHSSEHLLYNHDFTDEVAFQIYLDEVYNTRSMNCNIREGVGVSVDDRIITLSTCIANKPDKRYLVQGVLLNED